VDQTPSIGSLPARDKGSLLSVIEATRGTRNKMKFEPRWNAFVLDGVLPPGLSYPYDFGFVPSTLAEDGDPLDVLVLCDEPVVPGSIVPCRLIGVLEAEQQDARSRSTRNDRLIAVAKESHRYERCKSLDDLAPSVLAAVEGFFIAKNAQRKGSFTVLARRGQSAAERLIDIGERAFAAGRKSGKGSAGR
jgi:inorganic pyrophosphatase